MKKALMISGGWEGHDPVLMAERFAAIMREEGFQVDVFDTYDVLLDEAKLRSYDLFVPNCTMGTLPEGAMANLSAAIADGMGLAGCHGGMGDAFRSNTDWQFVCGGQFVAHPGGMVDYTVNIKEGSSPIVDGIASFSVHSEKYYMHVDPAIRVLATTVFADTEGPHAVNGEVEMPVIWTKLWGRGRVFYLSVGHSDSEFDEYPVLADIMRRGMLWASEKNA